MASVVIWTSPPLRAPSRGAAGYAHVYTCVRTCTHVHAHTYTHSVHLKAWEAAEAAWTRL